MTDTATVFVIDHDPTVLKSVARLLRSADHDVTVFSSAQEFLSGDHLSRPGCLISMCRCRGSPGSSCSRS
jgi:FixJ family two-component response regulator